MTKEYLARLRKSAFLCKSRILLLGLSPILIWGPAPAQVALRLFMFVHLGAWFYGTFAPNSRLFGPVLNQGRGKEKRVALTFDDGPAEPYSPLILDTLKRYGVKATFFAVGKKAEARQALVRRIRQEGHLIGNHTYSRPPHMAFKGVFDRQRVIAEIERGGSVLEAITGERPNLFRPPQGFKNQLIWEVCQKKGITMVGYTCKLPYYANGHNPSAVAGKVLRHTQPGSIISLHDGWRTGNEWSCGEMVRVLSKVIEELRAQEYRLVTVQEMVEDGERKG